jgi:hypothetical protein
LRLDTFRVGKRIIGAFLSQAACTLTSGVSMRRTVLSFALSMLVTTAVSAAAQDNTAATGSISASIAIDSTLPSTLQRTDSSVIGPSRDGLRAGVRARTSARPDQPLTAPNQAGLGQARAMMIVGGAALVVGAVIGHTAGTLIMVGGAVIGLVGLYQYLQ